MRNVSHKEVQPSETTLSIIRRIAYAYSSMFMKNKKEESFFN